MPLQLSLAVTLSMLGAGTSAAQVTVTFGGQVIPGAVMSLTVMSWLQVAELPHSSVARYVLVTKYRFAQVWFEVTSLTKVTIGTPLQLSLATTLFISGTGTRLAQLTVTGAGQVILGGVRSLTVIS
jgi:hypothetical protein